MASKGHTASKLMEAVRNGNLQAVVNALDEGADIEEADVHGFRGLPLRTACFNGQPSIVRELIARGANVDAGTADGPSAPLRLALRAGHRNIAKLLLEAGATVPASLNIDPELLSARPNQPADESVPLYDNLIEFTGTGTQLADTLLPRTTGTETNVLTMDLLRFNESDDATLPTRERNLDQELMLDPEHMFSTPSGKK